MQSEDGSVSIMAMASMAALAIGMLMALEFACAFVQKLALDNDLSIAREETFAPGFDMQLKNSPDPGNLIASRITESLSQNGFSGDVTVWFYEATDEELLRARPQLRTVKNIRAMAYSVTASTSRSSVLLPQGWLDNLTMRASASASICPYALYETYKPEGVAGRLVRYEAAGGVLNNRAEESPLLIPPELNKTVTEAISKATDAASDNR